MCSCCQAVNLLLAQAVLQSLQFCPDNTQYLSKLGLHVSSYSSHATTATQARLSSNCSKQQQLLSTHKAELAPEDVGSGLW